MWRRQRRRFWSKVFGRGLASPRLSRVESKSAPCSPSHPPDTGIASEKDWGINLFNEKINESGTNEDGSTWYRESGVAVMMMAPQNGEKQWEKYNAKGWTEKGAHKYGRLNDQSWWEKWGEQYDGSGSVLKWTDKWAETDLGTKWGDKWEEKFFSGMGTRQGETWHATSVGERWSRTWGEEHFGNGKVHKYGRSTTGESWDIVVEEGTYYEAEPHYGWADAVGNSAQLLSIQPRERPPGVYPDLDFGSSPPSQPSPESPPSSSE